MSLCQFISLSKNFGTRNYQLKIMCNFNNKHEIKGHKNFKMMAQFENDQSKEYLNTLNYIECQANLANQSKFWSDITLDLGEGSS